MTTKTLSFSLMLSISPLEFKLKHSVKGNDLSSLLSDKWALMA